LHADSIDAYGRLPSMDSVTLPSNMFDAMRRAHKDVQLVVLKGEDHWLSHSQTRLQMLQSSVATNYLLVMVADVVRIFDFLMRHRGFVELRFRCRICLATLADSQPAAQEQPREQYVFSQRPQHRCKENDKRNNQIPHKPIVM